MGLFKHAYILDAPINIYKGLAFEQVLFLSTLQKNQNKQSQHSLEEQSRVLFIWRAHNAVVLGRNQNPFIETNLAYLNTHNIALARRDSGGGTIFQDEHNLNICIISRVQNSIKKNLAFMLDTLKALGKYCTIDAKNNIFFETDNVSAKISGSAYRHSRGIEFHHYTLLLHTNIELLTQSLLPTHGLEIESKGIDSKYATVTNINIDHKVVIDKFLEICQISTPQCIELQESELNMPNSEIFSSEIFNAEYNRLISTEWIYGMTPNFTIKLLVHDISVIVYVRRGSIVCIEELVPAVTLTAPLNAGNSIAAENVESANIQAKEIWRGKVLLEPQALHNYIKLFNKSTTSVIIKEIIITIKLQLFGG